VLPGTDLSGAILVANQLLHGVASLGIPHSCSAVAPCVTISLGAAALLPLAGLTPEELIRWADEQLYLAKKEGRNRVKG
jgi:diguanylate cyclase (GGDEF)-like protein